jgi:hypothetical protein
MGCHRDFPSTLLISGISHVKKVCFLFGFSQFEINWHTFFFWSSNWHALMISICMYRTINDTYYTTIYIDIQYKTPY